MAIRRVVFVLMLLLAGGHALAADSGFLELEKIGKALYDKDRAAWLATDRLMESGKLPSGLRGWVTLPSGKGWLVLFVEKEGDDYCSRLSVPVNENGAGPLGRSETCKSLTAEHHAMFVARQTAISALQTRCSDTYNTVVLPHEGAKAAWTVYLLAATQEAGKIVIGGHVRVLVGEGGVDVVDYQQLSKGCLTSETPSLDEGELVANVVTHVLDDHPIETHVFLSLLHESKFWVLTESAMWSVEKGKISLLMDGKDFQAYMEKAKAEYEKEQ